MRQLVKDSDTIVSFAQAVKTGSFLSPWGEQAMTLRRTPPMTAELASKALALLALGFKQHQAAAQLGLNQGRISEVKTGKRFRGAQPCDPDQLSFIL